MEKENAGKASTELENSVTSEEEKSPVENKEEQVNEKIPVDSEDSDLVQTDDKNQSADQVLEKSTESVTEPIQEAVTETKLEELSTSTESKTADNSEEVAPATEPVLEEEAKESSEPSAVEDEITASENKTEPEAADSKDGQAEESKTQKTEHVNESNEFENVDFKTLSKEELVEAIKKLGKFENPFIADKVLKQIAPLFNEIRDEERKQALDKFIAEGGTQDDFSYKPDELSLRFDANYKLIKDKKSKRFKEQDVERTKNLVVAEQILDELREFVDSEESSSSFNLFKAIQQKWKDLGDVPSQSSRTLWANYNALVHRFYDQRSIYFELKELDRKKNYEAKQILCDKAEALEKEENLREAIKTLNDLHHEYKHMGPVPQDVQEELWQRFKAASDKIYERRKAFVSELKEELHENLNKKQVLIEKIGLLTEFDSDRIKEWNEKTKEVVALQKEWETIGGLPKEKAKQINKEFWKSFKQFFSNKHKFFKKLDADREGNLELKKALLEKANVLKDSEEWDKTGNELKKLQSEWREIGPVPEKMRKKIFEQFKSACDQFFERRRDGMKSSQEDYKVNFKRKKEIVKTITALAKDADKNLEEFEKLNNEFVEIGFVPRKNIESIKEEYKDAVEGFLATVTTLNEKQKTEISLEAEFSGLASGEHSETELYHKEQSVRRQINKFEDDIALWQNNLEFFAHSKSTDKLRTEVNLKISDAQEKVDGLKRQLKMLRSL